MPLLGLLLTLLPGLGRENGGDAYDAIYLFVVWALLIALAASLAPGLSKSDGEDEDAERTEDVS